MKRVCSGSTANQKQKRQSSKRYTCRTDLSCSSCLLYQHRHHTADICPDPGTEEPDGTALFVPASPRQMDGQDATASNYTMGGFSDIPKGAKANKVKCLKLKTRFSSNLRREPLPSLPVEHHSGRRGETPAQGLILKIQLLRSLRPKLNLKLTWLLDNLLPVGVHRSRETEVTCTWMINMLHVC